MRKACVGMNEHKERRVQKIICWLDTELSGLGGMISMHYGENGPISTRREFKMQVQDNLIQPPFEISIRNQVNLKSIQISTPLLPIDLELLCIDIERSQLSPSCSGTPTPSATPASTAYTNTTTSSKIGTQCKENPIEKLKSSIGDIKEMEIAWAKEQYVYNKHHELDIQDKAAERVLDMQDRAVQRALEENREWWKIQMELYEFRFKQWVNKALPEEPAMPKFE